MNNVNRDLFLIFVTRLLRLFSYGLLSVVLAFYLVEIGLSTQKVGLVFTLTLIGDAIMTLWLTSVADRVGRRKRCV